MALDSKIVYTLLLKGTGKFRIIPLYATFNIELTSCTASQ